MTTITPAERLRQITPQEFAVLGMNDIAYVKRLVVKDEVVYAIHSADGAQVAVLADRDVAIATIRQHDMEPLSLH